jgi:L-ascorbate metabolism protein UlaG (beta-lactamase superfamily)
MQIVKKFFYGLFVLTQMFFSFESRASSNYPVSNHYDGTAFYNPGLDINKSFIDFLKWQLFGEWEPWPDVPDELRGETKLCNTADDAVDTICVTFIGHATTLIEHKGLRVLTDPIWSLRASPVQWFGPKRFRKPSVSFDQLPKIDVVIISHNHYDHMDLPTLQILEEMFSPLFLVGLGNKELLLSAGMKRVEELDWWQAIDVNASQRIHFLPNQHWSKRTLWDTRKSLWGSFIVESFKRKIYFAGDTGYGPFFKEITAKNQADIDVALLPIGAYLPRDFMKQHHMNPMDAVESFSDLKAKSAMGVHFGTFRLTSEGIERPAIDLAAALKQKGILETKFIAPRFGQTSRYPLVQ